MNNIWSLATLILSLVPVNLQPVALSYHPWWQSDETGLSVRMAVSHQIPGPQKIVNNSLGVAVTAEAAIVIDKNSKSVLWEKNADDSRAIGSISKLVTAMVVLQRQPDWQQWVEIIPADMAPEGKRHFPVGAKIRLSDLFNASLMASDNHATRALARASGLSETEFIKAMNDFVRSQNLSQSKFVEVTGLSSQNVSTAREVAVLAQRAFTEERIRLAVNNSQLDIIDQAGVSYRLQSTNKLFKSFVQVNAAKTGYIESSGYCLTAEAIKDNHPLIVVNLGSATDADRFQDMKMLTYWAWQNYQW